MPAAQKNSVARLYDELVLVERDLGKSDLRHIELKGRVYDISDTIRKFPDGTQKTLKSIQLESKTGKLKLLTPPAVVESAKREHEKLLSRLRQSGIESLR
jgi:predicted heme/steroid binding protein